MARILIVDDEIALLKLLETYLLRQGHTVVSCATATEGLVAMDGGVALFDVAVLDHWLPDMSGIDLIRGVIERQPSIRILVSSGSLMDIEGLGLPGGIHATFLQKPYVPKMLAETIGMLLRN
ncbi:MAG: response regulator [Candidatus Solibacter usitatus]|nr:response regulator [Candidatus Solibacter usitatus]